MTYISVGENGSETITFSKNYKGDIQNVFGINFSSSKQSILDYWIGPTLTCPGCNAGCV
jgi:hypothetical protein